MLKQSLSGLMLFVVAFLELLPVILSGTKHRDYNKMCTRT